MDLIYSFYYPQPDVPGQDIVSFIERGKITSDTKQ